MRKHPPGPKINPVCTDLVCFIREKHSVEDLSRIVLDGINFNKMGRVATDTSTVQSKNN